LQNEKDKSLKNIRKNTGDSRKWILYIRNSLILLLFLFVQCTDNSNRKALNHKPLSESIKPDSLNIRPDTTSILHSKGPEPPTIINTDTCPKPVTIAVPETIGGSYIIQYETGPEKIELIPPVVTNLPLSKISGGTTIANPEAQGIGFFTTYTSDNGLALDGVTSSIRDKMGNLWFCTSGGGVSCYDGKSFTSFTTAQGLANNSVWCITEDKTGNLWFGTQGGISRYDGISFTSFSTIDGLANNIIKSITEDKAGNLWFGTNGNGVCRYDSKSFTNYTVSQGLANNYVYSITEDKTGYLWFGTVGGGVSRYDGKSFKNFTTTDGLANNIVLSITEDKTGNLWFGTYGGGISRYDGKSFTSFTVADGLASNIVWSITEDNSGNLWFGTYGNGISRYDGKSFTNFTTKQGLVNNIVLSITEDNSGNLWFGTNGGGISCYNGKSFTNFTKAQGLASNLVRSIIEDRNGNLWFGTDVDGVSCYDGKSFTNYTIAQGLANNTVWSIAKGKNGNLWFGTGGGGVSRYDGKFFTSFTQSQGLANNIVRSIIEDKRGNLWFGTYGGVSRYDGKLFTSFSTSQGLANNTVLSILEDKTGNLWFGTYGGGVSLYDGRSFTSFTTVNGLASNNVRCMMEDRSGNLWFGTEGGVSVLDPEKLFQLSPAHTQMNKQIFKNFTAKEGLPNNAIMQIIQSKEGKIYAGTSSGICEIILKTDGKFMVGAVFNSATGFPVKDVTSGFNTIYEDSKGIIWAATGSDRTALVRFDPKAVSNNLKPPLVVLQSIKVNNEKICWYSLKKAHNLSGRSQRNPEKNKDSLAILNEDLLTFGKELTDTERIIMRNKYGDIHFDSISKFYPLPQNLALPYSHNNISFEFNALEPSRHFMVRYQYMLEGYDKEWSPVTDKTTATFGNIFEGTYTFRLKASSPDGVWSEPVTYVFKVLPPWYRTFGMYSIYVVVFLSSLYFFYRWRVAKLQKENQILEEKVKLRTAQLQQANEEIEAQRDLVTKQKEHIEEIHKEVTDSINYAKRLQTSALPDKKLLEDYFNDLFILFKPKDIVSGDFYWFTKVKDQIVVTVADCTGHGVPGAFMSMLGMSLLREIVIKEYVTQPDLILARLRNEIIKAFGQTGASGEQKDGMDISICSINTKSLEMQWAGANNPCLIIQKDDLIELKGDKMPIAIYEKMDDFTLHTIRLQKSDIIYLFGDGYHDQFGGPDNKKYMSKRFKELLLSISGKPMTEQKEILDNTIEAWKNSYKIKHEQTDDITVMGLKIS